MLFNVNHMHTFCNAQHILIWCQGLHDLKLFYQYGSWKLILSSYILIFAIVYDLTIGGESYQHVYHAYLEKKTWSMQPTFED